MVSFNCESCGDVLTKKKLDAHRGRCHGASFTCLDCMVTFHGTEYRSHTSCMTEAQKYEGALYKEKPAKNQRNKSVKIDTTNNTNSNNTKPRSSSVIPRDPYVEDALDVDDIRPTNGPPPPAPSPPPATPVVSKELATKNGTAAPNVFDFLVPGDTPNASKLSLGGSKEPMAMVEHAPPIFDAPRQLARFDHPNGDDESIYDVAYEENGFSYGAGPIPPSLGRHQASNLSMEFRTPAPKVSKERKHKHRDRNLSPDHSRNNSQGTSDKKRKRGHVDDIDLSAASSSRFEDDTPMTDAPSSMVGNASTPALTHSGLTGGLGRMMREYSYSPEYEFRSDRDYEDDPRYQDPVSPIKRSKREDKARGNDNAADNGLGISIKGRAGRIMSLLGGTAIAATSNDPSSRALVRTRRRDSDGQTVHARKQKKHKVRQEAHKSKRRSSGNGVANGDLDDWEDTPPRRMKAIEYHRAANSDDEKRSPSGKNTENRLIVYRRDEEMEVIQQEKAARFLSMVNKGPDSERGCSIHKALKRYHREYTSGVGSEERERERDGGEKRGRRRGRDRGEDRDRRVEEERELWRSLRLKRNERGEVVVFL